MTPGTFETLAPLESLMDKCVHCGFCLATCPSYLLLGQEMASPRGRIYLLKAGVEDRVGMTDTFVGHFDTCLGCMACETACPSGVRYAPLVEHARAAIEHHHARPLGERIFRGALFRVLPYPARLRLLTAPMAAAHLLRRFPRLLALLPLRLRNLVELAPATPFNAEIAENAENPWTLRSLRSLRWRADDVPAFTPARGSARLRVGLLTGCVQRVFFGGVNDATVRVLAAEGCEVVAPPMQGCCGALALHAGKDDDARDFARRLIAAFDPPARSTQSTQRPQSNLDSARSARSALRQAQGIPSSSRDAVDVARDERELDQIVVNAAGCGSTMKMYGELLKDDPVWAERAEAFSAKVRDVTETLAGLLPARVPRQPMTARVAYHDACHLAHAQGVRREPRELLATIPGLTLVPLAEPDICCGSAGIFNLVQPEMAATLGQRKAGHIAESEADLVVTSNPGCILQIGAASRASGRATPVIHIVELIDRVTRSG